MSLNITLFQNDKDPVQLSAITAGGSQAVFFKINTWGEEAFLDKLIELLDFAKRIMYGRNSFDLLKAKVLLHEHFRCEFN